MGKRSHFPRREHDAYPTPIEAVVPLVPHLRAQGIRRFVEPCAGDGDLIRHLTSFGLHCAYQGDVLAGQDALAIPRFDAPVVTNPPWRRDELHRLLAHFIESAPLVWLLLDLGWASTRQARILIRHCSRILPIGRPRWIPGSPFTAKDDAAWYEFTPGHTTGPALLSYRAEPTRARTCEVCGLTFTPQRATARFHDDTCRQRAHRARRCERFGVTLA